MFVNGSWRNEQSLLRIFHRCFLPNLVHFAKRFQRRRFLKISNICIEITAFWIQISIFKQDYLSFNRFFRNQPIRNKNCLWQPYLLMDRDEMSNLYRGHSIDSSYQVSVHLAKQFQRRRFLKSANQKQESPVAVMFVNGSGRNEQSLEGTFHRCFLPSFTSFGWVVSEEKIKMWKVNGQQTPSDGKSSHCLLARWAKKDKYNKQAWTSLLYI
jgi:hypothetical protein